MLAKINMGAKFCGAVAGTVLFHVRREIREFVEDVEVEFTSIWWNIKELFGRDEKF